MSKLGVLGSLQTKIAHSTLPSLGNKDLKLLQDSITAEKTVIASLQRLANDYEKANEALKVWGQGEGEDLGDVLSASKEILGHVSIAFTRYAEHVGSIRSILKSVRTREEQLDEARKRRRTVIGKAEAAQKKLSKMSQENKGLPQQTELLMSLRNEISHLDGWIFNEEAMIMDFKRNAARDVLQYKVGGIFEMAEKLTIVGELGKLPVEEISTEPSVPGQGRPPYTGYDRTRQNVQETAKCVNTVVFQFSPSMGHPVSRPSEDPATPGGGGLQQDSFRDPAAPQASSWSARGPGQDLPYQLPAGGGMSPTAGGGPPNSWTPPSQSMSRTSAPGTPQSTSGPYAYNEFGQMSSPSSRKAPGTFPMAAAGGHTRDGAYSSGPETVSSSRPSMPSIFGIRRRAESNNSSTPAAPVRDIPANLPLGAAQPSVPGPTNPWQEVQAHPPPQQYHQGPAPQQEQAYYGVPAGPPGPYGPVVTGREERDREYHRDGFWVDNNSNLPYVQDPHEHAHVSFQSPVSTAAAAEGQSESLAPEETPTIPDEPEDLDAPQAAPPMDTPRRGGAESLPRTPAPIDGHGPGYGQPPYESLAPPSRPRLDTSPTPSSKSGVSSTYGTPSEGGTRTISAAAFRRPARASGEAPGEVSPLHVRKKAAPSSSPYPAAGGDALPDSDPIETPHSSYEPAGHDVARQGTGGESIPDLPSPAYMVDLPTPVFEQREGGGLFEGEGERRRPLPSPPPPGYAQGQFSTNLE